MAWIKRNLFFLIFSLVALAAIGGGVVFLLQELSDENQVAEGIGGKYSELQRLSSPTTNNAGTPSGIDNVKTAEDQTASLRDYISKIRPSFQKIKAIPDVSTGRVAPGDFPKQLDRTVAQLQATADQHKVELPKDYYFTFEAQRRLMTMNAADVGKLAVELGEVKAICDILFDARINALNRILREPVSQTDNNPPDYLPPEVKSISSPLADRTPYQVEFVCFSGELAEVLAKLASSPHGFVVRLLDVEPAVAGMMNSGNPSAMPAGGQPVMGMPAPTGRRGGPASKQPTTFLKEQPLRVILLIEVVKPK